MPKENELNRYMLLDAKQNVVEEFRAESDDQAEAYIEENYTPEDGFLYLICYRPVCTWT